MPPLPPSGGDDAFRDAEKESLLGVGASAAAQDPTVRRQPLKPPRPLSVDASPSSSPSSPAAGSLPLSHPPPPSSPPPSPRLGSESVKLLFGAGGIYASFLYYGSLQEDVFSHVSPRDGTKFSYAWFLQLLEALANVAAGFAGLWVGGSTRGVPKRYFALSGASQVCAKAFTSLALANGLSFPVATLAKSGKMAPVMAGQLVLGGDRYSVREYLQVAAIVGGTAALSLGKKKGGKSQSTPLGLLCILISLLMDGVTGGVQKRLKADLGKVGVKPGPYDFMFWTNLYMSAVALLVALTLGELTSGLAYVSTHADVLALIVRFSVCSAVGQSFVFYTVAHFDPLVCSTVTTTRKIFSVLLSILIKGHRISARGWAGVALAVGGIGSEVHSKVMGAGGGGGGGARLKSKSSFAPRSGTGTAEATRAAAAAAESSSPTRGDDGNREMRHRLRLSFLDEAEDERGGGGGG